MPGHLRTISHAGHPELLMPGEEKLDRALVAGLMLEVFLETPAAPADPEIHRRRVRSRLTHAMVRHLAGRITLDRFRTLVQRLDVWFPFYYPLMPALPQEPAPTEPSASRPAAAATPRPPSLLRQDRLQAWLAEATGNLLPRRPQGKLQPARLADFCRLTHCCWFKVKDFAQYFGIDRKTAWEYVQKLQEAGLLLHNQGRSAAVRYRLADYFLKIELARLEQEVALASTDLTATVTAQVAQGLAVTACEPFWEEDWPAPPAGSRRQQVIAALHRAGLLELVCRAGERRLLRLPRHWLSL